VENSRMKLDKNLREFIELLNTHGVEFLVVGGHAVAFHGYPRLTGDIDVFVAVSEETSAKLMQVLQAFGFGDIGLKREDFLESDSVVQLGYPPNRIDIVTGIDAVTFAEAWSQRQAGELDGVHVQFIAKDLLIRNKRAVGRPKDLADAAALGEPGQS
jgi:hypothetical protein